MAKVLVRLRPSESDTCIEVNSSSQLKIYSEISSEELNFDTVGDGFYSQQDIFEEVGSSVASSLKNGKDQLIMALGQKGSGKSYSLFGNGSQVKGLIDMVVHDLKIKGFELSVSCYEIFNQQILDLLSPVPRARQLKIVNNKSVITQLTEIKLLQQYNIQSLLESARKNRKSVKIHSSNELTNSIVVVSVQAKKHKSNVQRKVTFVELADYQNVFNDGRKLQVTGMNSKSMNSFIRMVHCKQNTFQYNSSKLTQIIKDSLNDNCNKSILAHLKPEKKHLNETLFTLELANKIKNLKQFKIFQSNSTTSQDEICANVGDCRNLDTGRRTTIIKQHNQNPMNFLINNQKHFKNLIQLYEDRIYQMEKAQTARQFDTEKKILEKVAHQYAAIVRNFPTFSQIMVENMSLRQHQQVSEKTICSPFAKKHKLTSLTIPASSLQMIPSNVDLSQVVRKQNEMLEQYEEVFESFKEQFVQKINQMSRHYLELEKKYKAQSRLHYATASIRDFIIQDEDFEAIKTELEIVKQENKTLRKKNCELAQQKSNKNISLEQLQSLKIRLLEIKSSIVKDQQNQKYYLKQISNLKKQLEEQKQAQFQQNITVKKPKIVDKSQDRVNQTVQTLLFEQGQSQIANSSSITNKQKISLSKLLHRMENKQNLGSQKMKTLQNYSLPLSSSFAVNTSYRSPEKSLSRSNEKMVLENMVKQPVIQKSELERLRLILLKSKQKTNKTKMNLLDNSFKHNLVQSKSSILSRNDCSGMSSRRNSRPLEGQKEIRFLNKYRPFVSERHQPQNKSSID